VGGFYRGLPFWGVFASITFLILLGSSTTKPLRIAAVTVACFNLLFGASIFFVTVTKGMESYPSFYPLKNGKIHFGVETIRDKYDLDYSGMVDQLRLCQSVFLDLPLMAGTTEAQHPYLTVNLLMFLENNSITHYMSIPYRNESPLQGGAFHLGFKRDEVQADCVVEEELRDGRIGYKFVQAHWY
jgi:hypothetical protein